MTLKGGGVHIITPVVASPPAGTKLAARNTAARQKDLVQRAI